MTAIPREAATVILVRDHSEGAQALLIRRHADIAFAGGSWVFPGGKLETADRSPAVYPSNLPEQMTKSLSGGAADSSVEDEMAGFLVAACRETFEETGVLLARHADGEPCTAQLADDLQSSRAEVCEDPARFAALMEEKGLVVDAGHFIFWSHWITPSMAPKRFDTRFLVAPMPPDQSAKSDTAESSEILWLDLLGFDEKNGESLLPAPPTRYSLANLAAALREHGSLDQLMRAESERSVAPITPKMIRVEKRFMVLMPWDTEYPSTPGEGTVPDAEVSAQYHRFPSRVVPSNKIPGMPSVDQPAPPAADAAAD